MITGFNTDIEHDGVTYHVQTEDKGLARPIILSLVYDRGTILASKRAPYDDLLNSGFDEGQLAARLQRQHRLICAAIQAGRIEELRQMTARESAGTETAEVPQTVTAPVAAVHRPPSMSDLADFDTPIPKPVFETLPPSLSTIAPAQRFFDAGTAFDEFVLTDDVIAVIRDESLEPAASPQMRIELANDIRFRAGERQKLELRVARGNPGDAISNAQIMVKVLGSSFRPLIYHSSTDTYGIASIDVQFPNFTTGRAAVLVRAIHEGQEVEFRRSVDHA